MTKEEFTKQWQKQNAKMKVLGVRAQAIRERIMKAERYKMQNIENYTLDAYGIETMPILHLLKRYGLTPEYNTNEYDPNFLMLIE